MYWNQRVESWEAFLPIIKDPKAKIKPIVLACLKCLFVRTPLRTPTRTE